MTNQGHRNPLAGWAILAAGLAGFALSMNAGPAAAQSVAIDKDDIGGVVTGAGDRATGETGRTCS